MATVDLAMLAGGTGVRIGGDVPKQFLVLAGKPIIAHTMGVFEAIPYIGTKYVTCPSDSMTRMADILSEHGFTNVVLVEGGATRLESVMRALERVETERVIIHLAIMPFATKALVDNLMRHSEEAVIPTLRPGFTISQGSEFMEGELDRSRLHIIQAPQLYHTETLRRAHQKAREEKATCTEDSQMVFRLGGKVRFIEGLKAFIDIKTPFDLAMAELLLSGGVVTQQVAQAPSRAGRGLTANVSGGSTSAFKRGMAL